MAHVELLCRPFSALSPYHEVNRMLHSIGSRLFSSVIVTCSEFVITDDVTRVILIGGTAGGYINANYLNMEIPGSGIINRYIATQGMQCNAYTVYTQYMIMCHTGMVYTNT
jgi:protein tyrosine phosphatase